MPFDTNGNWTDDEVPARLLGQEEQQRQEQAAAPATPAATTSAPNATSIPTVINRSATPEQSQAVSNRVYENVATPNIPQSAQQTYTTQQIQSNELQQGSEMRDTYSPVPYYQGQSTTVGQPANITTPTLTTATGTAQTSTAAQGTVGAQSQMSAVRAALTEGATANFEYTALPDSALVQNQIAQLLTGMEDGEVPAWAKPAVAAANQMLAERGVGRSSVGRDTLYNAIIQSALPIASADAQAKQQEWLQNLSSKERMTMFNASTQANMDLKNADYLQQATAYNAQAFLQMDFNNMSNQQRTNEVNAQYRQQTMLTNQAAENATRQMNAQNELQVQEFMRQLSSNISLNNAARRDAMIQYNTGQVNNMRQFNAQLDFNQEQFNATMRNQIEQSNVNWRRNVNTANTAGINAANQANAINAMNLSNASLAMIWQEGRDVARWAYESSQNEQERAARMAMAILTNEQANNAGRAEAIAQAGILAYNILGNATR